jgi:hypothetical protein
MRMFTGPAERTAFEVFGTQPVSAATLDAALAGAGNQSGVLFLWGVDLASSIAAGHSGAPPVGTASPQFRAAVAVARGKAAK